MILLDADGVQSAFLERMNALLAAGEVPGLWPADDLSRLLTQCRDARRSESVGGDADDDAVVLKWFSSNVRRNLHVVFCLEDLCSASTTASPALFNRCVVDWFGTWSTSALAHVGDALLADVDVEQLGAWDERELSVVESLDQRRAAAEGLVCKVRGERLRRGRAADDTQNGVGRRPGGDTQRKQGHRAGLRRLLPPVREGCRGEERSIGTAPATQAGRPERTGGSQ